jgi:hypothetical protein
MLPLATTYSPLVAKTNNVNVLGAFLLCCESVSNIFYRNLLQLGSRQETATPPNAVAVPKIERKNYTNICLLLKVIVLGGLLIFYCGSTSSPSQPFASSIWLRQPSKLLHTPFDPANGREDPTFRDPDVPNVQLE